MLRLPPSAPPGSVPSGRRRLRGVWVVPGPAWLDAVGGGALSTWGRAAQGGDENLGWDRVAEGCTRLATSRNAALTVRLPPSTRRSRLRYRCMMRVCRFGRAPSVAGSGGPPRSPGARRSWSCARVHGGRGGPARPAHRAPGYSMTIGRRGVVPPSMPPPVSFHMVTPVVTGCLGAGAVGPMATSTRSSRPLTPLRACLSRDSWMR